jgi:glycosyltransferase involved in cell wall biosynthesis
MSANKRSVCLIAPGLSVNNVRLQPWRYLGEVVTQLRRLGHSITLIGKQVGGIPGLNDLSVHRLTSSSNLKWGKNRVLVRAIEQANPDVIVWHVGLTSFIHQNFDIGLRKCSIGIFTSPIYELKELMRLSPRKLISGYRLSGMALVGSLLPSALLRARMWRAELDALVVQTETTRKCLQGRRLWSRKVQVIPPGVDRVWRNGRLHSIDDIRRKWGYSEEDTLVVYFGSPAPLRGLPVLLEAIKLARRSNENLKLLVLSRQRDGEFGPTRLKDLCRYETQDPTGIHVVKGLLSPHRLASIVSACDVVALPFELVPSDAPLSLLEGRALGKPLVTTRVACLPELAGDQAYLALPGEPTELAVALLHAAQGLKRPGAGNNPQYETQPVSSWEDVGTAWSQLIQNL